MGIDSIKDVRGSGHVVASNKPCFAGCCGWRKIILCDNGFALLEVLVAITVLLLVAVAMVPLFSISSTGIVESGNLSQNQYTAQQSLENAIAAGGTSTSASLEIQFPGVTPIITVHGITQQSGSWRVFIPNELGIIVPNGGMPTGTSGLSYISVFTATGGTTPYSFTLSQGSLPAGLVLNSSTGAVTGTPTSSAASTFTLQVTDSSNPHMVRTRELSIVIN